MIVTKAPSFNVAIHMAGDIGLAGQIIQRHAIDFPICVTIAAQSFIYTGGREDGFIVGFINYPRFPAQPQEIIDKATALALKLMMELGQHSFCIVTPVETIWRTRRVDQ